MIDCVACDVPDRHRAVALLEDEDDDPVSGRERDEVQDRRLERQHDRAERAGQQDAASGPRRSRARRGSSSRRRARSRDPRPDPAEPERPGAVPCRARLLRTRVDRAPRTPGRGRRRRSGRPRRARRGARARPAAPLPRRCPGALRACAAIVRSALPPSSLDEHVERLHHAGRDAGRGEHVAAGDRVAACRGGPSPAPRSGSAGVPKNDEHADDREPGDRDRAAGGACTNRAQRPQAPSSGWPRVDEAAAAGRERC